jgi:hypothetical protein
MRPSIAAVSTVCVLAIAALARATPDDDGTAAVAPPIERPRMQQADPGSMLDSPPSARDIAVGRPEFRRRFREPLSHSDTAVGARIAAESLLDAAATENDRTLKWLILDEARRLGEAAGQAGLVSRAVTLASANYEFDAIDVELRSLKLIPLRGLDANRAAALAVAAEQIATRAEADRRLDKAVTAELLAYRGWQRAGNAEAARQAAVRHDALEQARRSLAPPR